MSANAIRAAIEKAGSRSQLARMLRVDQTTIRDWLRVGQAPAARVLAIERLTGVSRHELRPDLYPRERRT